MALGDSNDDCFNRQKHGLRAAGKFNEAIFDVECHSVLIDGMDNHGPAANDL